MKHYITRRERDRARRHSFSYRFKFWFWSNHMREIKMLGIAIGNLIMAVLWFGGLFFIPHIFH